ncbi:TIGR01244 family sulfur transferase [Nitrincola sp.]|uniref:TIGR01244 family sulfur transferase n=1 Tax=Nitrincola sp. TaxID=1926584 RepID=UPI003A907472
MDIKELEPGFSICHAIYPAYIAELKARGFRSIICNRRPGEAEDHLNDAELSRAAQVAGIEWIEIPVTPGEYTPEVVETFGIAIETLPAPILGFCRSGRRAVSLWIHNQMQQDTCDIGPLLMAAHAAGHDLSDLHDRFIKQ